MNLLEIEKKKVKLLFYVIFRFLIFLSFIVLFLSLKDKKLSLNYQKLEFDYNSVSNQNYKIVKKSLGSHHTTEFDKASKVNVRENGKCHSIRIWVY